MAQNYRQLILDMYNEANPDLPVKPVLDVTVTVADQITETEGTEENGWRNTIIHIGSLGGDDNPFENSIDCHYKRVDTNCSGGWISEEDALNWENDTYVLAHVNERLQEFYPDDEFVAEDLRIRRMPSENEPELNAVFVTWLGHLKFLPIQGSENGLEFILPKVKQPLEGLNGELNGFK